MPTLTDRIVKDAPAPPAGQILLYDDHKDAPRGFGLRITAGGTRSFILRYRGTNGKDRRMTIGEYPTWSLAAARKQADEYRRQVNNGSDILEDRRIARTVPTVSEVLDRFHKAHLAGLKSGKAIRACLDRYLVPAMGKRKLRDIRRRDVIAMVEDCARDHPRQAALLLGYTKLLFAWAEDREIIEANPAATLKPMKIDKRMAPKARQRVLDDEEIRALWTRAEESGLHRMTAFALKMILITGQRPGEVAGMRWEEIQGDTWMIPAARRKTDTPHSVPLTDSALKILETAKDEAARLSKRRKGKAAGYVFEARPGAPITGPALCKAVERYADALGNKSPRWAPHDLRRTCRTGLAACGVAEVIAERVIGHGKKGLIAVYDQHQYDKEKRLALKAWERHLKRIVQGKQDEKVVRIGAA